ncbi:Hsp70 chaperone BiP/Kar2 [Apiospora aurea]|uniref:Hsp70 chaperone BiP/Kar2 n=1 Tax=Apiospora aurea TaxID=335848 RepID=A0ABR1Q9U4_9PEZI
MLRPLANQKDQPVKHGTTNHQSKTTNSQRAKFWGTLLLIIASLATVTFLVRSGLPKYWDGYDSDLEYGPIIGIDIGNTYARVAYTGEDFIDSKVSKDSHGNTSIPTCVAFTDTESGSPNDHRRQAQDIHPPELVGLLMGKLKNIAEAGLGVKVTHATIAVPPDFDAEPARAPGGAKPYSLQYPNRNPMEAAAALGGLRVLRFVKEPIAAAIAYGVDRAPGERNVLVYDVGGEKTQISLMEVDDGVFEMLSTVKLSVGGRHFNERVVGKHFKRKNGVQESGITADSLNRLQEGVEMAKRRLSTNMFARIEIPDFYGTIPLNETVTRAKFEDLNKDLYMMGIGREPTDVVPESEDLKLKPADIDDVIFSGGSSHVRKVNIHLFRVLILVKRSADHLKKLSFQLDMFFDKKHAVGIADEAVVKGAAIQGAFLSGYSESMGQPVDIHPLTIGVESADGLTVPVIRKFTIIPTRKSVKVMAARYHGEESKVVVNVIEGERLRAKDNRLVGELDITGILSPFSSANHTDYFNLSMEIDANGVLAVIAYNPATEKETRIVAAQPSDDARDSRLVESLVQDGEKHRDFEGPLMEQYKQMVDLESFALAVKKDALAKMVLPKAARGQDESMSVKGLLVDDLAAFEYDQIYKVGSSSTGAVDGRRDEL